MCHVSTIWTASPVLCLAQLWRACPKWRPIQGLEIQRIPQRRPNLYRVQGHLPRRQRTVVPTGRLLFLWRSRVYAHWALVELALHLNSTHWASSFSDESAEPIWQELRRFEFSLWSFKAVGGNTKKSACRQPNAFRRGSELLGIASAHEWVKSRNSGVDEGFFRFCSRSLRDDWIWIPGWFRHLVISDSQFSQPGKIRLIPRGPNPNFQRNSSPKPCHGAGGTKQLLLVGQLLARYQHNPNSRDQSTFGRDWESCRTIHSHGWGK